MRSVSVSSLKAHLSAELKKVEGGESVAVLDHRRPVAVLGPVASEALYIREATAVYACPDLTPLTAADPLARLAEERGDR
jgi:antitoxin (DNA-binding transcriptional repressor) of toxin-antitoxin stability system